MASRSSLRSSLAPCHYHRTIICVWNSLPNGRTRVIFHVYIAQYLPTQWRRNAMNIALTSVSLCLYLAHLESVFQCNVMLLFGDGAGSPMLVRVINPAGQMTLVGVGADAPVPVGQPVVALINTQGAAINAADLDAAAKGLCHLRKCNERKQNTFKSIPLVITHIDNSTHALFKLNYA